MIICLISNKSYALSWCIVIKMEEKKNSKTLCENRRMEQNMVLGCLFSSLAKDTKVQVNSNNNERENIGPRNKV